MRREVDGVRAYETENLQELYTIIDYYIEQDNANAFVVLLQFWHGIEKRYCFSHWVVS